MMLCDIMSSLDIYARILQEKINKSRGAFEAMKEIDLSNDAFIDLCQRIESYKSITQMASSDFGDLADEIFKEIEKKKEL